MLSSLVGAWALALAVQGPAEASVGGVVRDADTGRPLAGATVVLDDLDRGAVTDAAGRYSFRGVPAGPQHLTVGDLGYAARTLHLLVPRSGRLAMDVALSPAPIALGRLVVAPARAIRGLDPGDSTAFPDRGVSADALRNHPTLAEPDAFRALAGGEVVLDPEAATGVHVRGGAADHTAYLLDGVPVLSPYHAAGLFSAWNPDALSRLTLLATAPSPGLPDALAGVVAASTRDPGGRLRMQGAVSNTQARVSVDGPAGVADAGYLVSWRSGFPGSVAPKDEGSYLDGETGDLIGAIRFPALAGRVRLLVYDSENELATARAVTDAADVPATADRQHLGWRSRSLGGTWGRAWTDLSLQVRAWRATADADALWLDADGGDGAAGAGDPGATTRLESGRRDHGVQLSLEHRGERSTSETGIRVRDLATRYRVGPDGSAATWEVDSDARLATAYGEHAVRLGSALDVWAGASATATDGAVHLAPRVRLRWRPTPELAGTVAWGRTHQYSQSVRNPESVVSYVFPADLFLGTALDVVPVPRGDQVVAAGEWRPAAGVRLGAQAYRQELHDLLLVAPREEAPFATGSLVIGAATARGVAVDAAASGARYGVMASYGWQRVRVSHGDSAYVPGHGATHLVDAGLMVYPTATSALRLAVSAGFGRTTTPMIGPFEWEACNLLDGGCEFAGAPRLGGPPGSADLPTYVRLDVGGSKHWHIRLAGRDARLGVSGTLTNVLGRKNVLTWVVDPETGRRQGVEMIPRAPLVVGIDWRVP